MCNQLGETGLAVEWPGKAEQAGYTVDKIRSDPGPPTWLTPCYQ
ncbi:MAG: hypothetical protein ABSH02_12850 [Candidatus Sulfotelmatobacter sp.]